MNEKELFEEVLNNFIKTYGLTCDHVYNDEYFIIHNNVGTKLGSMNPAGKSLLENLYQLTDIIHFNLY